MNKKLLLVLSLIATMTFTESKETQDNKYENSLIRLSVTKPQGWLFSAQELHEENLKRVALDDKAFKEKMVKYSTKPLVVMMKHPEPFDDINPSFKITMKPLGKLDGEEPMGILSKIIPQLSKVLPDFKLAEAPKLTSVDGLKAAYMRANYSLEVEGGAVFPSTSEMWIVPRGDYFFMIGSGTRQDEKTGSRDEITAIIASITLK